MSNKIAATFTIRKRMKRHCIVYIKSLQKDKLKNCAPRHHPLSLKFARLAIGTMSTPWITHYFVTKESLRITNEPMDTFKKCLASE